MPSSAARIASASLVSLFLAGTALAPAAAVPLDLGGLLVTRGDLLVGGQPATIISNGTLDFVPAVATTFGGQLTNGTSTFSLIKRGTLDFTLTGTSNNHTGTTTVSAGSLIAGATNTLSPFSTLNANSTGVMRLAGFNQTVLNLIGTGTVTSSTPATLTLSGAGDVNFTGAIAGGIQLVKNGAGVQGLLSTTSNTYSGGTILNAGELRFGNSSSFGTGAITVNGDGTARLSAFNAGANIANNVIMNSDTEFATFGQNTTFSGVISGAGALVKRGPNQLELTNGANNYAGGTRWVNGRIAVTASGALSTGDVTINDNNVNLVTGLNSNVTLANNFVVNQIMTINLPTTDRALTLSGNISGSGQIVVGSNPGTLNLTGSNGSHTGGYAVSDGRVAFSSSTAFGTGGVSFTPGGIGIRALADNLVVANSIAAQDAIEIDTQAFTLTLSGGYANRLGFATRIVTNHGLSSVYSSTLDELYKFDTSSRATEQPPNRY